MNDTLSQTTAHEGPPPSGNMVLFLYWASTYLISPSVGEKSMNCRSYLNHSGQRITSGCALVDWPSLSHHPTMNNQFLAMTTSSHPQVLLHDTLETVDINMAVTSVVWSLLATTPMISGISIRWGGIQSSIILDDQEIEILCWPLVFMSDMLLLKKLGRASSHCFLISQHTKHMSSSLLGWR